MKLTKYYLIAIFVAQWCITFGQQHLPLPIIPQPASVQNNAESFRLSKATVLTYNNSEASKTADLLNEFLFSNYGFRLKVGKLSGSGVNQVNITHNPQLKAESYTLTIKRSGIKLSGDAAGIFYGLQTLQQLCPSKPTALITLPG